jgi:5'(3')-deoxyribonucleotidase
MQSRIAIDMDEVSADTMGHYLSLYNAEFEQELTREHFHGKHVWEVIDQAHQPRARQYFQTPSFFAEIPVMPDSQSVIRDLMQKFEIFIVTAAMDVPCSFDPKFSWLQRHFPFIPSSHVVFCGDKSIVAADYLIDDDPRHFKRFRGEGILFSAPHNAHVTSFRRVNSWLDVRTMFLEKVV